MSDSQDIADRINQRIQEAKKLSPEGKTGDQPMVYGFTLSFNDDGKPVVEEFGNTRFKNGIPVREPLTDILKSDSHVVLIMELPGIEEQDIELTAARENVTVDVESENRLYHKKVDLGCIVEPKTVTATLKNGILEVTLNRLKN